MTFGIGQAVARSEDARLLTGHGRFVADLVVPGTAHALFLRSPHAHADVGRIDADRARALPGVLAVYSAADLAPDGLGDIPCAVAVIDRQGQPLPRPGRPLLAGNRVRFVGEPVAMVVAESINTARDARERIEIEYRTLPAVAEIADACAAGAPRIWDGAIGNIAFFWQLGDADAVREAFRRGQHVVELELINNRVAPCPLEPRAVIGTYDVTTGRYTLYTSSQGAHTIRHLLAEFTLKVDPERLRVVVPDVGGGFGTKFAHYPEEALALWAAAKLRRPVKWVGDRTEAFIGDSHGRAQRNRVRAALDGEGRILALDVHTYADMGAYLTYFGPAIPSQMTGCMLSGAYAIPALHARCEGVYTNTVPVDAYRGAGRPEATYLIERLIDSAARTLGRSPVEIRQRNFIAAEAMPYRTASGCTYDSGDFNANLMRALAAADWAGLAERKAAARRRGRLLGLGLSTYVEISGYDSEEATLRFSDDGRVELLIGTQSTGQGHETAYAQIVAGRLGIPFADIRVVQGDTDRIPFGRGTSGSRSLPVGGPAVEMVCDAVIRQGRRLAARLLQAAEEDVAFADGRFAIADGGIGISLTELAAAARRPENRPADAAASGLDAVARYRQQAPTFPNGCHVCEVEIDPETGVVEIVGYHVADDFGTVINPLLLAGQIQGGVAQGIGQALMETVVYDRESAQIRTGSFVDYALPRARDIPAIEPLFNCVPCTTNPLGIKGAGEAGAIAACPAVINAILDALQPLGVRHIDMPATPETIWAAIRRASQPAAEEQQT